MDDRARHISSYYGVRCLRNPVCPQRELGGLRWGNIRADSRSRHAPPTALRAAHRLSRPTGVVRRHPLSSTEAADTCRGNCHRQRLRGFARYVRPRGPTRPWRPGNRTSRYRSTTCKALDLSPFTALANADQGKTGLGGATRVIANDVRHFVNGDRRSAQKCRPPQRKSSLMDILLRP